MKLHVSVVTFSRHVRRYISAPFPFFDSNSGSNGDQDHRASPSTDRDASELKSSRLMVRPKIGDRSRFRVEIRFILLVLCGQKQVALENAALRQQLAVFKRNVPRPKLNNRGRLFWIGLYMIWQDWKSALITCEPRRRT